MSKFSHLKKLDVADAMSWMELPEVSPNARLLLKPAGESNSSYYNAMLKKSGKRARQIARTETVDAAMLAANRRDDRELFPLYVLAGWEGIEDTSGNPVQFTRENAKELCKALPDWIFDRIRNHAATPERFLAPDEEAPPDPAELAGNSESASSSS